jgi:O-succinylbenzoic acid--CoA ligase
MVVDILARTPAPPERVALVSAERTWTYGELATTVDERAAGLRAEGRRAGDVVPVVVDADADGIVTLLALWRLGATPAPLNARLTEAESEAARRELEAAARAAGAPALAGDDGGLGVQAILWTSGTAGRPRGVALSLAALEASARGAAERLGLHADDVWLASLSPAHVGGLALISRSVLLGCTLVAVGPFDARSVSELIDGRGGLAVTHVSLVPTQLLRLFDARADAPPPATFRCALVGGARAPDRLVARALECGWPIALTYGLTEATSQVATAPPALVRRKPGTVGPPLDGVEVRMAADGEILVRGATLASGYVASRGVEARGGGERGDDVSTEALVHADGWHHTGDLGHIDEEGDLWVTGRRIDRIVTGGVTVDAVEVEEALRAHPAVRDAGVVGLPDEEWGERVGAWIELADALDLPALDAWLRERLSPAKLPRVVHVAPGLPRNANGKLDRKGVRRTLEAVAAGRLRGV